MEGKPIRPENHLVGAILVTLFCCLPFGIVAILNAAKVDSAYERGDYDLANQASQSASKWIKWSLIGWVVALLSYIVLILVTALH